MRAYRVPAERAKMDPEDHGVLMDSAGPRRGESSARWGERSRFEQTGRVGRALVDEHTVYFCG